MTTPRFFISSCLLIWAWQTGITYVTVILALGIEWSRYSRRAWDPPLDTRNRIGDLTLMGMLAATLYAVIAVEDNGLMNLLQAGDPFPREVHIRYATNPYYAVAIWMPILLFPFALLQAYGRKPLPFTMFSWLYRRGIEKRGDTPRSVDFSYPYAIAVIIAAGAGNQRIFLFYAALCVLFTWALLANRQRRYPALIWGLMIAAAMKLGYHGAVQLNHLQGWVEQKAMNTFQPLGKPLDPRQSRTSIGSLGQLKLSGQIIARIGSSDPVPTYLRSCLYSVYLDGRWLSSSSDFTLLDAISAGQDAWRLRTPQAPLKARIWMRSHYDPMILPIPSDSSHIERLPADVSRNPSGTLRAHVPPNPLFFDVYHGDGIVFDGLVTEDDLQVPDNEPVLAEIANELGLQAGEQQDRVFAIQKFFLQDFSYSLVLERPESDDITPLEHFLRHSKAGHCEYYATATTLLLRTAGIPARYTTGYAIAEGSDNRYIIRDRHAHAWVRYFDGRTWQDLDTTAADWLEHEEENASSWEFLSDSRNWLAYMWSQLRNSEHRNTIAAVGFLIVFLFLGWRGGWFRRRKSLDDEDPALAESATVAWPGADSELFTIEAALAKRGFRRPENICLDQWLMEVAPGAGLDLTRLHPLIRLHQRLRFDPIGLPEDERQVLSSGVQALQPEAQD